MRAESLLPASRSIAAGGGAVTDFHKLEQFFTMMRCISHTRWGNNESDSYTCLMPGGRIVALAPRSSSGNLGGIFASCLPSSVVFSS